MIGFIFVIYMCVVFRKSCLVKVELFDYKRVDVGNFKNKNKIF